MCLAKVTVGGFAGNNFQVICITKVLAKFLGLNVTPRSFVSGHVVRGERSFEIRHRNQLTAKAWEKAVQELGNLEITVLESRDRRMFGNKNTFSCQSNFAFCGDKIQPKPYRGLPQASHGITKQIYKRVSLK